MKDTRKNGRLLTRKGWIFIAVLAVVIVVLLVLLLYMRAAGQSPYTNRVVAIGDTVIPNSDGERAMRYNLTTADEAEAYFQRLLDSEFIGLCGDVSEPAELVDGKWHLREQNGDGTALTAEFDKEGVITSLYIGTNLGGEMTNSPSPYVLSSDDESIYAYVRAFAYAYLPDVSIVSGDIVLDQYNDEGRFVTLHLTNNTADPAFAFVVQVEPVTRIVGFSLLADEDQALIRSSRKSGTDEAEVLQLADGAAPTEQEAIAIARSALTAAYDIPKAEVDAFVLVAATYYNNMGDTWYGFETTAPYWLVSFRMPETDDVVYSDYDVILDGATGEVLQIFDPTNNSNG